MNYIFLCSVMTLTENVPVKFKTILIKKQKNTIQLTIRHVLTRMGMSKQPKMSHFLRFTHILQSNMRNLNVCLNTNNFESHIWVGFCISSLSLDFSKSVMIWLSLKVQS